MFSSNRIATYDSDGRYLHDISSEGKATNEFIKLDDVTVESDKICTFDHLKQTVNCFDTKGNLIKTTNTLSNTEDIYKPLLIRKIDV